MIKAIYFDLFFTLIVPEKRIRIMEYTDYHVKYFREILNCI